MIEKLTQCPVCEHADFIPYMTVRDHFLSGEEFPVVECKSCGFRFVNPRPDQSEIGRYYQSDEYISHDAGKKDLFSRIYRIARSFSLRWKYGIVNRFGVKGTLLDIGCGTGEFLNFCRQKGFNVQGVEPSPKAGAFATKQYGIPVSESLDKLDAAPGSFRIITLWHVLEHLHRLNENFDQIGNLLEENGTLVIAVPNCDSPDALRYREHWAAYDVPRHLYHFNAETLGRLAERHGFEVRSIIAQKLDAYYVALLSEQYLHSRKKYFNAFLNGFRSNMAAGRGGRGHSSRVFILTRKKR